MSEKFLRWWDKRVTQLAMGLPENEWKYRDKQIAQHIRKLIENQPEVARGFIDKTAERMRCADDSTWTRGDIIQFILRELNVRIKEENDE